MSRPVHGSPAWDWLALMIARVLLLPAFYKNCSKDVLRELEHTFDYASGQAHEHSVYRKQQSPRGQHARRRR